MNLQYLSISKMENLTVEHSFIFWISFGPFSNKHTTPAYVGLLYGTHLLLSDPRAVIINEQQELNDPRAVIIISSGFWAIWEQLSQSAIWAGSMINIKSAYMLFIRPRNWITYNWIRLCATARIEWAKDNSGVHLHWI